MDLNFSSGIPGLDSILTGIRKGDNVVHQVTSIDDYLPFVLPFVERCIADGKRLNYFRFADHPPLLERRDGLHYYELHPERGFESFISDIFRIIEESGIGACYVFDSLSDLSVDWHTDRMLGNFFRLTCPYLYDFDTVAYFALFRSRHSSVAVNTIQNTAQIVMNVYSGKGTLFVQPLKVDQRHSPTMYFLHRRDGEEFIPVRESSTISDLLARQTHPWTDFSSRRPDLWTLNFQEAEDILRENRIGSLEAGKLFEAILHMMITREDKLFALAERFFSLRDLVTIRRHMIGTGLIGGKAVGMLLSRAIVKAKKPQIAARFETHDSFFIGSDVFYSYIIENGCWWDRRRLKATETFLVDSEAVRSVILAGKFPRETVEQFAEMLNYFGQSPIIVRSSSLLEDAYGNAFSGRYESVFCANQGAPEERLEAFLAAVQVVYASAMSDEALLYRRHWNLLEKDEQMAILVQRVSGSYSGERYFPHLGGVAFSFNPFVWHPDIDPEAGMLRVVFGLGTRAVDRSDDDYTRIVALNQPEKRPESRLSDIRKYSQRRMDVIDLVRRSHATESFETVAKECPALDLAPFASRDTEMERDYMERGIAPGDAPFPWVLTLDPVMANAALIDDFRVILSTLEAAYEHPVDVEFTVNFQDRSAYRINLLQCRPFQIRGGQPRDLILPADLNENRVVLRTGGPIIGNSRALTVDWLIYVRPSLYGRLPLSSRYSVARLVGRLAHATEIADATLMIVGPGRWATSMPQLGVPVSNSEIDSVNILCEIAAMHEGLVPDVSLGTHFFNDLVELDMLYLSVYPDREGHRLNEELLLAFPNELERIAPDAGEWAEVVRLVRSTDNRGLQLFADALKQSAILYLKKKGEI